MNRDMKKLIWTTSLLILTGFLIAIYIPQCIRVIEQNMKEEEEKLVEDIGKVTGPYYAFLDAVMALCEDPTEDKNTFIQKLTDLLKEQETWKEKNKDMGEQKYLDLTQLFGSVLFAAIYDLRRSLETDTNPITKDKKTTAIAIMTSKVDPKELDKYIQMRLEQEKETNQKDNNS